MPHNPNSARQVATRLVEQRCEVQPSVRNWHGGETIGSEAFEGGPWGEVLQAAAVESYSCEEVCLMQVLERMKINM